MISKTHLRTLMIFCIMAMGQLVSAQELSLYTGVFSETYYQDDQKITRSEFNELLKTDDAVWQHWRRAATFEALGSASAFGSGILLGLGIGRDQNDKGSNTGYYIGGAGAFIVSMVFVEISQKNKRSAVLKYNENLERKTTFKLAPSREGIGIAVHF